MATDPKNPNADSTDAQDVREQRDDLNREGDNAAANAETQRPAGYVPGQSQEANAQK